VVHPLHFVIVEDDQSSADAMRLLLERGGHRVQVCMDASSAVEFVCAVRPDVALIDIMMPVMDGIEVCRRLHTVPALRALKSVVVTGKIYDVDRTGALAAGARGVLHKPLNPQTFVNDVLALVNDDIVVSYWGVRGLLPVPGPATQRYGGNTSCVTLDLPCDTQLIFDAGSGIKALSDRLMTRNTSHTSARMLISHPHWDHLNALSFFEPLYVSGNELEIMGPSQGQVSMRELVTAQFDPLYSSVSFRELSARVFFRDLSETTFHMGAYTVRTLLLAHPGNCLGYRVDYSGRSFCYVPNTELPLVKSAAYNPEFERKLIDFVAGADVALMDATYGDEVADVRRRRGYSNVRRVAEVAHEAGVRELQLFHHGPQDDDQAIDRKLEGARAVLAALGSSVGCTAPAEGTQKKLTGAGRGDGAGVESMPHAA